MLFPTTVVGSFPQPDWLVDRSMLSDVRPARAREELWRVPEPWLEQAQDDATMRRHPRPERAGIDIITDGEIRRESYSNRFATALDGIDIDNPGDRARPHGPPDPVPRVVGPDPRRSPCEVRDVQFLRAQYRPADQDHPARPVHHDASRRRTSTTGTRTRWRWTTPRPSTPRSRDLFAAGADVVQLDEPCCRHDPEEARSFACPRSTGRSKASRAPPPCTSASAMRRVVRQRSRPATRSCPSSRHRRDQISIESAQSSSTARPGGALGQADHSRRDRPGRHAVETPRGRRRAHPPRAALRAAGAAHPRAGLRHEVPAARVAFGKLKAMVDGARMLRAEHGAG